MKVLLHDFNAPLDFYGVAVGPEEEVPAIGEVVKVRDHDGGFQIECRVLSVTPGKTDPSWQFLRVETVGELEYDDNE